ncbi:rCG37676, partial [Rattus norvegicus]
QIGNIYRTQHQS